MADSHIPSFPFPSQTPTPAEKALKIQDGGVPPKKKRNRPPEPAYISHLKTSVAQVNEALKEMREEKKKRRAEKEAARKKVTFREKAAPAEPENEEAPVTQHQPEEPIAMEEDEAERDDLRTDEVMPTEEELVAGTNPFDPKRRELTTGELVRRANPFARKMSRII